MLAVDETLNSPREMETGIAWFLWLDDERYPPEWRIARNVADAEAWAPIRSSARKTRAPGRIRSTGADGENGRNEGGHLRSLMILTRVSLNSLNYLSTRHGPT